MKVLREMTRDKNHLLADEISQKAGGVAYDAVVAYSERLAHDANNYIGAIMGLAEVLPAIADDPDQVHAIATRISAAAQLLQVVVNQSLLPVRSDGAAPALELERARELADLIAAHLVGPKISVEFAPLRSTHALAMTQGEFCVLLFILLRNAIDAASPASHGGSRITVSLDEVAREELVSAGSIGARVAMHHAIALRVSDNGVGLPDDIREDTQKAFQPFVTRSQRKSALGLGLTFAAAIVERRGGAICVAQEGETMITAYLPIAEAGAGDGEAAGETGEDVPRVVIVDPKMQWGAATSTLLGLMDWSSVQVGSVADAAEVLAAASRERCVLIFRLPAKGLKAADVAALKAQYAARRRGDLLMLVGMVQQVAADESVAAALADMAVMSLPVDAVPADIVNYLIPNI